MHRHLGSFALEERADGPPPVALLHWNEIQLLCFNVCTRSAKSLQSTELVCMK
jgi:hypothetical protein